MRSQAGDGLVLSVSAEKAVRNAGISGGCRAGCGGLPHRLWVDDGQNHIKEENPAPGGERKAAGPFPAMFGA